MGFLNEKLAKALFGGDYICSECGERMFFENEWKDILICSKCGHSIELEHYGFESEEAYDALYPTKEEVLGYGEDGYCDEENEDEHDLN